MPHRVMNSRVQFFGRQWDLMDLYWLILIITLHCLCALAPFQFTWGAFWVAISLYFVSGLGVTLSYHRNLAHRSFKVPKWLEYSLAYCAVLSLQGSPIEWVSSHRYHHQYTDESKDPHSPTKGLWFSHLNWVLDYHSRFGSYDGQLKNVGDLECQLFYRILHYTYICHSLLLGAILYAAGGFPFVIWGMVINSFHDLVYRGKNMVVRMLFVFHITSSVNSICHTWGKQVWDTGDRSKNNWLFGLLAHGEGWHNNHHAFEYSARHGLEWWQIDSSWYVIKFLQVLGLATEVKLPTEIQKRRKALAKKSVMEDKVM